VSYVWAGYGVTAVALVAYIGRVLRRGRTLSRSLPPEERTWQ
jgi:heme exporter protein CcmD